MKRSIIVALLLSIAVSAGAERIRAACTDFSTGMLSSMLASDPWTPYADELSIHSDAVLRWGGEYLVLVERLGVDAIRVLDPDDLSSVSEFSTGAGSNPQDIVVVGEKAYISLGNSNDILIVEWPSGAPLGSVSLSAWADEDGYAEPAGMVLAEDLIFIAIQRLDRDYYWLPVGDSYLAVLDPYTDTLVDVNPGQVGVQAIALPFANPAGELQSFGGYLWLSCVGAFGLTDGALVRVDPVNYTAGGFLPETDFLGDIGDTGFHDGAHAWAIVTDASFNTNLWRFDPSGAESPSFALAGGGWVFNDLEVWSGQLFLGDQSYGTDGVRVMDAASGLPLAGPVDLGLPPYDLLAPSSVSVDAPEAPASHRISAWPNPFNPKTTIRFDLEAASEVSLSIFDCSGRKLRTLIAGEGLGAGKHVLSFDGRDDHGESLPSGIYHARVRTVDQTFGVKLVLMK